MPVDFDMGTTLKFLLTTAVGACLSCTVGMASAASSTPEASLPLGPRASPGAEIRDIGNGARIVVEPGSTLRSAGTLSLPSGNGTNSKLRALSFILDEGRIDVVIPKSADGRVAVVVKAPGRVSIIARWGHSAILAKNDRVLAAAYSGTLTIAAGPSWSSMREGNLWLVDPGHPRGFVQALVEAPAVTIPIPIQVVAGSGQSGVSLKLAPIANATGYRVAVSDAATPLKSLQRFESSVPQILLDGLAPGKYSVVACAVDTYGLEGVPAPQFDLHLVGMELPLGAYLKNGTPYLGRSQKLRFTHTEGLEFTYGSGDYFVPLPTAIGLNRGRAVLLRLREPGSTDEVQLRLEPSVQSASIQLGPPKSTWPNDRVWVQVRVSDTDFMNQNSPPQISPIATINGDQLSLDWKCRGEVCAADVPASSTPGPWVLRVDVRNAQGALLDHAFLAIARSRRAEN